MTSKLSKTIVSTLALVFTAAPLVLAQSSGSGPSGMGSGATGSPSERPGMSSPGTTGSSTTGTPSPSMGTMGAPPAIPATVDDINQRQQTVKLRMQDGKTVELKVPEQALASLSKGDSVQVSINKTSGPSGMAPGTQQPSRPETGSSPGSPGPRSR
jgi:hypothetical protein